jgi:ApaG protein
MERKRDSDCVSEGIRVIARPVYLADHSDPDHENPRARRFAFGYTITIRNEGEAPAQLLRRHWVIVDANGERQDVEGEGVVGEQPRLEPGDEFEYTSWAPIHTSWGTMEGEYTMRRDDGSTFDARIGRFYLVAELETASV